MEREMALPSQIGETAWFATTKERENTMVLFHAKAARDFSRGVFERVFYTAAEETAFAPSTKYTETDARNVVSESVWTWE